jgi:uncharacterized membrane protein
VTAVFGRLRSGARSVWARLAALGYYRTLFTAYVSLLLATFIVLVPPFQKSDEPAHFHRAVAVTNLDLVCKRDENGVHYFEMKRKYADLPEVLHTWDVAFDRRLKFDTDWLRADFSDPVYDQPGRIYRFCSLRVPGYLPSALGVLAGKPFENPLASFYLGRVAGALFFALCLVLALRLSPERYRLVIYFYGALPVVLHQVSAISYDAVQLSLFPLLFALIVRLLALDRPARPLEVGAVMLLLFWIVNVRLFAYYPVLLLFFVLPPAKVAPTLRRYIFIAGAFVAVTIAVTAAFDLVYIPRATDSSPEEVEIDANAQVRYVLENPLKFLEVSYRSLRVVGEGIYRETIGVFGWIDWWFSPFPYYVVTVVGALIVYRLSQEDRALLGPVQNLALLAAVLGTVAFLFLSLYAVWSPVGGDRILGLQGRYFLGLFPFVALWCSQTVAGLGARLVGRLLALALAAFLLFHVLRGVIPRYY